MLTKVDTGTKTLHLRCVSREAKWIDALLAAKDLFPRTLTSSDFAPSEDIVVSTEKLRSRMLQEGLNERVIDDCDSIMQLELSELQNQLKALQHKYMALLKTLRQLEGIEFNLRWGEFVVNLLATTAPIFSALSLS